MTASETVDLLAEGFEADAIVAGRASTDSYIADVENGRSYVATGKWGPDPLRCLHRLVRFYAWMIADGESDFDAALEKTKTGDKRFFEWLRRITVNELGRRAMR